MGEERLLINSIVLMWLPVTVGGLVERMCLWEDALKLPLRFWVYRDWFGFGDIGFLYVWQVKVGRWG
ncbi:hypothetical protein LX92_03357 [Maribacter polysiphoniae]|uniref:Uncharacterized protein n=1 Tax=Maribacter polysiphoniae TaxID=429344 RepID=A0A316DVR6_9FLAO|nr:hypothetical protein LX92_03357 [Maribacter polysiphoniae]